MKISVVIPAYNCASFIGEAIESVLKQKISVHEIIVVDDGSEDDTGAIIRKKYPKVRIFRQKNGGPAIARNRGVAEADGDWIAFLDADDIWTSNKIEEQLSVLKRHPQVKLIASDMAEIDIHGNITIPSMQEWHGQKTFFENLHGRPIPRAAASLMGKNFIPTGTVLVERDVLLEKDGFNSSLRYGEDLELWVRIAADHPISCLPNVHMLRRRHGSNATNFTMNMAKDLVKVAESVRRQAREALEEQGADVDQLVSQAWANLGYALFDQGQYAQARKAMMSSFKEKPNLKAVYYWALTNLPSRTIQRIRSVKHRLSKV